ncbi:MAG: hypothetical protein LUD02_11050 [Tannerellaceae bacterium]|nr:hypothetical protein [Tannerellaceae bacterium]MCD8264598.1 hypothetical protein [Tannerellaceae bacterium]
MNRRCYIVYSGFIILAIFLGGCIRNEIRDCDEDTCIRFRFVYDYNEEETDLFAE